MQSRKDLTPFIETDISRPDPEKPRKKRVETSVYLY